MVIFANFKDLTYFLDLFHQILNNVLLSEKEVSLTKF